VIKNTAIVTQKNPYRFQIVLCIISASLSFTGLNAPPLPRFLQERAQSDVDEFPA
jgi:hypothetical protein